MKGAKTGETIKEKVDLIIVGNQNSGKTSLINKFVDGEKSFSHLYNPTLGINLEKRIMTIDKMEVTVCIWDTAGQEKFFSLTKNYFRKADGILIIFDLTDKLSFQKVCNFWIEEAKQRSSEDSIQIVIGNKVDMTNERVVPYDDAKQLAEGLNLEYFETSAKTGENVSSAIEYIVRQCLKKILLTEGEEEKGQETIDLDKPTSENPKSKCFFTNFWDKVTGKTEKKNE